MANQIIQSIQPAEDEIDLSKLFGIMIDAKWFIIGVTLFFSVFGIAFALLSTPIYKADALIQIEKKKLWCRLIDCW
ncbi:protein involved in exopolysaccharide biosynthesis [Vibrio sp. B1FLJ16]|nr:protein involved in exopolysaccharide biosynthesis [Vibrio sp. B1FLJ16]CAE6948553.1 protein involved in exopolysaccharide biosynthesis [Vibrio sp. B1FLJ16]